VPKQQPSRMSLNHRVIRLPETRALLRFNQVE